MSDIFKDQLKAFGGESFKFMVSVMGAWSDRVHVSILVDKIKGRSACFMKK